MAERIISCFIDESGDFGPYDFHCPFYYVVLVIHDQQDGISRLIDGMEQRAAEAGYPHHAIHTGPLIRRENEYSLLLLEERKHLFNILYHFAIHLPIHYVCVKVAKSECPDDIQQTAKLSKLISQQIQCHEGLWQSFDKINVYYDKGQKELTKIITSVFNALFTHVELRKVAPVEYKLFQVADLICTMELINDKAQHNQMTRSETEFFDNTRSFKKDYYKKIAAKQL